MNIKIVQDGILVSQATKSGYIFCKWGGCFDALYPSSKLRRGRVIADGDICNAITAEGIGILIVTKKEQTDGT